MKSDMFRESTNTSEVSESIVRGVMQTLSEKDTVQLLEQAQGISQRAVVMLGIEYICFWLFLVYADLRANEPQKADKFMHEVIDKTVDALNGKTNPDGFLCLIHLKADLIEKYFYGSWVQLEPKTQKWIDQHHRSAGLESLNEESWLGQLTLLLFAHVSLVLLDHKEWFDDIPSWMMVSISCSGTALAYGNVFIDKFKEYKIKF